MVRIMKLKILFLAVIFSVCFCRADAQLLNMADNYTWESFVMKQVLLHKMYKSEAAYYKQRGIKKIKCVSDKGSTYFIMRLNEEGMPSEIKRVRGGNFEQQKTVYEYDSQDGPSKISYYENDKFVYYMELMYKNGMPVYMKSTDPDLPEDEALITYDEGGDIEKLYLIAEGKKKVELDYTSYKGVTIAKDANDSVKYLAMTSDKFVVMMEPDYFSYVVSFRKGMPFIYLSMDSKKLNSLDKDAIKNLEGNNDGDLIEKLADFIILTDAYAQFFDYDKSGELYQYGVTRGGSMPTKCTLEFEYFR